MIVIPMSGLAACVDRSSLVLFMNLQCPGWFKNQETPPTRPFDWPSISDFQVTADLNAVALVGRFVLAACSRPKFEVKRRPNLEQGVIFRRKKVWPPLLEGVDIYKNKVEYSSVLLAVSRNLIEYFRKSFAVLTEPS